AEKDVIGLHEEWLGRAVTLSAGGVGVELGEATAGFRARLASGRCHIAITLSGVLGSCRWGTPTPDLFLEGPPFERLTRSGAPYRAAWSQREMLRVATRATLADRSTRTPGMFAGFDRRRFLPPQLPVGRGQDLLFFRTLAQCRPDALVAHLPW